MSSRKSQKELITYDNIQRISSNRSATVHFVGVGGVSMYSLARLTILRGASVSGSDREDCQRARELASLGAKIFIGHSAENARSASLVVYTHAIPHDNPELTKAQRLGIPTVSRAEYMGALMLGYTNRIGVCGSHGKSTTTAMLDCIFSRAGLEPTTLSGSNLPDGEPLRIGSDGFLLYEACEYKDSFLRFSPTVSVGLNLELDHTDYFTDINALKQSFAKAFDRTQGFCIINGDDENFGEIIANLKTKVVTFGSREENCYRYSITKFKNIGFDFSISRYGSVIGNFEINIPGVFNVHNAAAAIVTALEYGIDIETVAEAIGCYRGIEGRLEYIGTRFGRPIYYDYAHHPTEIAASINALKQILLQPLTVVFKPHTFSRTAALWQEFCDALSIADYSVITDIFPARELPVEGITSERLAECIGERARYSPDGEAVRTVDLYTKGAIVLMGAGNFDAIKKEMLKIIDIQ